MGKNGAGEWDRTTDLRFTNQREGDCSSPCDMGQSLVYQARYHRTLSDSTLLYPTLTDSSQL
jgi:hypothetical protein